MMMEKLKIFIFLVYLICSPAWLFSQQKDSVFAVISDVSGKVFLKKAKKTEPLKAVFGMQLMQGDQVLTQKKSKVELLFSDGNLISLGSNSNITISGKQTDVHGKNIGTGLAGSFSDLALRSDSKGEMGVLIDLRSTETDQTIIPMSPCNTMIKSNQPVLSWESTKPAEEYVVRVYNNNGLVWEKKTSETKIKITGTASVLHFGESYFWNVEGIDLIDSFRSSNQKFTILSQDKILELESMEGKIKDFFRDDLSSSSFHSVLGAYYAKMGLLEEAIREFEMVKEANPESSLPHEILGKLYSDVGKKDLAIIELQEALKLEKEK
ncbi:MAG: hypothetical protein AMS23_04685 [Bacteroides sp. SM1_62]|nr:MAG: hypothetical protein AMS26_15945 [Bacteroides sp. SM23_62]KPL25713.1 MAG: hypothetical protein AMS23_04685 [Bacteroides sp. SM1_62]